MNDNYQFANEECSSGCESGWTLYLDHSSNISQYNQQNDYLDDGRKKINAGAFTEAKRLKQETDQEDDDDEDLSMVSDASSGPPHLHEEVEGYGGNHHDHVNGLILHDEDRSSRSSLNRKKKRENNNRRRNKSTQDQSSLLDDTASSPFLDFSNTSFSVTKNLQPSVENVLEYSQGYSTTQFEVRPPYQEQYDFFQSENQLQQNQWFEGGKMW